MTPVVRVVVVAQRLGQREGARRARDLVRDHDLRPVAQGRTDAELAVLRSAETQRRTGPTFDAAYGERHQLARRGVRRHEEDVHGGHRTIPHDPYGSIGRDGP